jgi:micrococcal nuclease
MPAIRPRFAFVKRYEKPLISPEFPMLPFPFQKSLPLFLIVLQVLYLPAFPSSSEKTYGDAIVSEIIDVHDGDTFKVNITGYPPIIGEEILVRIRGVDTPELRGDSDYERALAKKAQLYAENRLRNAKVVKLRNMGRDKYFRILADVFVDKDNLAKELIRVGLGHEYDGGTKRPW